MSALSIRDRIQMRVPPLFELALRLGKVIAGRCGLSRRKTGPSPPSPAVESSKAALGDALHQLGIGTGDILMVHASAEPIGQLGFSVSEFLDLLLEYLGPAGTLAVPTHSKIVELDGRQVFDVQRSPSKVGLFSEIVRRRKSAIRSGYPVSSAAAIGRRTRELVGDHERSVAPHDEHSPYSKLAALGGKVLCVGVPITCMTIIHVAEDVMQSHLYIEDFYEAMTIWVRSEGKERPFAVRERAPWLWWYLALHRWTRDMYRQGFVRDARIGDVVLHGARASEVVDWMKSEVLAKRSIYPLVHLNRVLRLGSPLSSKESHP